MYDCSSWNNNFFFVGMAVLNDLYSPTITFKILVIFRGFFVLLIFLEI